MSENPHFNKKNTINDSVSNLLEEGNDYTKWRKRYFSDVDLETLLDEAVEFDKTHPFREGNKK